jgi:hypothetical protein
MGAYFVRPKGRYAGGMTSAERLDLLLDWINGDKVSDAKARQLLLGFLHGFAGRNLRCSRDAGMWDAYDASNSELEAVRRKLRRLLESALPMDEQLHPSIRFEFEDLLLPITAPSLRFGVHPKSHELMIEGGRLRDLVPFLVAHELSRSMTVVRCEAPAPRAWESRCGRFRGWLGKGRRPRFCRGNACRVRHHSKVRREAEREDRRQFRQATSRGNRRKAAR